uniref:Uncharacterized protein n=1 Tax=Rhizophora mucronata TaxID=61149 RepID=A0A2P2P459_RHIMU
MNKSRTAMPITISQQIAKKPQIPRSPNAGLHAAHQH